MAKSLRVVERWMVSKLQLQLRWESRRRHCTSHSWRLGLRVAQEFHAYMPDARILSISHGNACDCPSVTLSFISYNMLPMAIQSTLSLDPGMTSVRNAKKAQAHHWLLGVVRHWLRCYNYAVGLCIIEYIYFHIRQLNSSYE